MTVDDLAAAMTACQQDGLGALEVYVDADEATVEVGRFISVEKYLSSGPRIVVLTERDPK